MITRDARTLPRSERLTQPRDVGTVRLGVIDYLNVWPVYEWLLRRERTEGGLPGIATVAGVPAQVNQAMAVGDLDVSNVSSVAFGEHAREWLLLPRLSVAAHGRVESVLLFSWYADWRDLDGRSIALSEHSATSIALVRLLCERRYGAQPRYVLQPPDLDAMLAQHDAALLIGDSALVEGHLRREIAGRGHPYIFDLATEWQSWTGLPFVFAVWAARADRVDAIRMSTVVQRLHASKEHGLAGIDRLAGAASARFGLPTGVCSDYLQLLDYNLSAQDLRGLRHFLELALPDFRWTDVRFL
jgi:chorismate dehydratase